MLHIVTILALLISAVPAYADDCLEDRLKAVIADNQLSPLARAGGEKSLEAVPVLPTDQAGRTEYARFLEERLGMKAGDVTWGDTYPMTLDGATEEVFAPVYTPEELTNAILIERRFDVTSAGAGLAGQTVGIEITRAGGSIDLLDAARHEGGLATGKTVNGIRYGQGGAYASSPDGEVAKIYRAYGIKLEKDFAIVEPIDNYVEVMKAPEKVKELAIANQGEVHWATIKELARYAEKSHPGMEVQYFRGLYESQEVMDALPADFSIFLHYLKHADARGIITTQPMESFPQTFLLDQMDFATWVRTMPLRVEELAKQDQRGKTARESRRLLKRFEAEMASGRINSQDPMAETLGLLDRYGPSALGRPSNEISAAGYANFYSAEIGPRFTGNHGSGTISDILATHLKHAPELINMENGATVLKMRNLVENGIITGVETFYRQDGKIYRVLSEHGVFAGPVKSAVKIIEDYARIAPESFAVASSMKYSHYFVINVHLNGQPWQDGYDLWLGQKAMKGIHESLVAKNPKWEGLPSPTDVIDGRWIDFAGKPRTDSRGVLTIYLPLPQEYVTRGITDDLSRALAEHATAQVTTILEPLIRARHGGDGKIQILGLEVNRWLNSIHVVEPGHFEFKTPRLLQPIGRIRLANSNIGLPSIEEAIFRGHQAGGGIVRELRYAGKVPKRPPIQKRNTAAPGRAPATIDSPRFAPIVNNRGSLLGSPAPEALNLTAP